MSELYEDEQFIYNQVPVRVFCHSLDRADIYTTLHWHRNIEFNLVTKGRICMIVDGDVQEMYPGEWCVINSSEPHSSHWIDIEDHYEGFTVQISKSFMDHWMGKNVQFVYPTAPGAAQEIENALLIFGEYYTQKTTGNLEKMKHIFHFLILLQKYCVKEKAANEKSMKSMKSIDNVKSIINYIDEHFQEPLKLVDISDKFHYTSAHFSRMFKEHMGCNFYAYIQNVRLMHCVEEMKENPHVRLLDCAIRNGFPNVKSFIQTFKKSFGCTPSEWIKKDKK